MCARTGPPPGDVRTQAHVPGEAQADFGDTLVINAGLDWSRRHSSQ